MANPNFEGQNDLKIAIENPNRCIIYLFNSNALKVKKKHNN
jgi:hypothetical protein